MRKLYLNVKMIIQNSILYFFFENHVKHKAHWQEANILLAAKSTKHGKWRK